MSSGPDNVTQTTKTTPSPYLTQPIQSAVSAAQGQFGGSSDVLNTGKLALANRGLQGSPLNAQAGQLVNSTLQGDYLSPDTNPFLASTFDRAADLTRTRLSSEFAGAGRDLGAAMPARSEELQTLASNIFGQNYARERGIQSGAVGQAQSLANQDYTDINAVLDAGNFDVDNLINRIQGLAPAAGGTAVSAQPLYRNRAAGALGGAASGASIGASTGNPYGAAIGAIGGGLAGLFG